MIRKPLYWLGSSLKDIQKMPGEVKDLFGYALDLAQCGERSPYAKPFHLQGETGVIEIVEDYDGDTYRAVYTIKYKDAIYVIHCFQKKSTQGIKTPQHHVDLIKERLAKLRQLIEKGE